MHRSVVCKSHKVQFGSKVGRVGFRTKARLPFFQKLSWERFRKKHIKWRLWPENVKWPEKSSFSFQTKTLRDTFLKTWRVYTQIWILNEERTELRMNWGIPNSTCKVLSKKENRRHIFTSLMMLISEGNPVTAIDWISASAHYWKLQDSTVGVNL